MLKLLIAYHKPDIIFKSDILEPIHVGRSGMIKKCTSEDEQEKLNFMLENMIGDDTGDNISDKNPSYNEMTSVYWAWKNYDKIGNPDYIGFMHYRRHFLFKEDMPRAYYECNEVLPDHIENVINCNEEYILEQLKDCDFIATKPYYKSSVYDHYKENHRIEDLDLAVNILKKMYPEYVESCDKYLHSHDAYFCNMFIFPKDIFFEYCQWIFSILFQYEKQTDIKGKRLFISERLTGIFFQHLIDKGLKAKLYPTLYVEENIVIPIAMATDIGYLLPTAITMTSILENAKPTTKYDFYIMVEHKLSNYANKYLQPLREKYPNCIINIVDMNNAFSDLEMNIKHITYHTYYRLYLPTILKKYNKCFYLDSDIIVNGDLTSLFRTNIDEYLVAGVKAAGYFYPVNKVKPYLDKTGLKSIDQYVNAGVLLMNLKKMRDNDIQSKFLALADKGLPSQDQDIINIVCYNQIKLLPLRNNLMTKYFYLKNNAEIPDGCANYVYSKEEIKEALANPLIVHYADKAKPWGLYSGIKYSLWRKYEKICPIFTSREKKKISIILPIYNVEQYLAQCLTSIQQQVIKKIEIMCIVDGSTDKSLKIVEEFALKDNRIFIMSHPNSGVGFTRNRGLEFANSEFIAFMDPDDYYPSEKVLSTLYDKAIAKKVKICGGSWSEDINGTIKTEFKGIYENYTFKKEGLIRYRDYQFDYGYHRFIYDLEMLNKANIRFPLYSRFQDPPFFIKAMVRAENFYAVTMPTYCYRFGHQSFNWADTKMRDLLLGLIDDLRISNREQLAKLHYITYTRINNEYSKRIVEHIKRGTNFYLLELLVRANSCLNPKLLAKFDHTINDNVCLNPLQEVLYSLQSKAKNLDVEIRNIRKSRSYRIGRFITAPYRLLRGFFRCLRDNGFKYTMKRVAVKLKKFLTK